MTTELTTPTPAPTGPAPSTWPALVDSLVARWDRAALWQRLVALVVVGVPGLYAANVVRTRTPLLTNFALLFSLVAVLAIVVVARRLGFRRFTFFFAVACATRPLVDLTAGPRDTGVSLTEVYGLAVLAALTVWLFLHRRDLAPRLRQPLALPLLALAFTYAMATLGSAHLSDGISATLRITAGVAVFLVVDLLLTMRRLTLQQLAQVIALIAVVPLTYPVLAVVGVPVTHQKDGITALKSVFFLSNNLGHFLVPLLLLGVAWALRSTGARRWAAAAISCVIAVELVLSQTRGAWLGGLVGVVIVCVLLNRRVAVVGGVAVVLLAVAVPSVNERITDLKPRPDEPYSESSLAWRFSQWDRLLPEVGVNPFLGSGPGQSVRLTGKEAHNDYLKAGVETGVLGFVVYLWFLGAAAFVSWRAYRRVRRLRDTAPGSPAAQPLVQATFAAVAAYSIAIMFGSAGENLIDNLTFLWATLPLFAMAQWAITARRGWLRIEGLV